MKRNFKIKNLTRYLVANVLFLGMLLSNTLSTYASETTEYDINQEIAERESLGAEIYKFVDDDRSIIAYFEPYSEINPAPVITPRASSAIDWVTDANTTYISNVTRYFGQDQKIHLNISQSPSGAGMVGYIGLYDVAQNKLSMLYNFPTANGFEGTLTPSYSGNFQLAIENASSSTITYKGTYSW